MVVIKTGKVDLKECECASGSDCGLCCKINTHSHAYTHTHTAVNNEAASAGFKEPHFLWVRTACRAERDGRLKAFLMETLDRQ